MVVLSMFSWWYTSGFMMTLSKIKMLFVRLNDQFSIPLLAKTLFQPFRQISADAGGDALEDKMRAWLDKLISRLIGGFIRLFMMVFGLFAMIFLGIFSVLRIAVWLLMPILPFGGFVIASIFGVPQWIL